VPISDSAPERRRDYERSDIDPGEETCMQRERIVRRGTMQSIEQSWQHGQHCAVAQRYAEERQE
jgi:hypothetical protein